MSDNELLNKLLSDMQEQNKMLTALSVKVNKLTQEKEEEKRKAKEKRTAAISARIRQSLMDYLLRYQDRHNLSSLSDAIDMVLELAKSNDPDEQQDKAE